MKCKKILQLIVFLLLSATVSQATVLTVLHGTKGQADKELLALSKKFDDIGYTIAAKNEHLENHYYNKFNDKNLDLLNFYRIYDKNTIRELLLKNPDFGAFTPFNFLAFKKPESEDGGDTTWYGELTPEMMLDIIGEKDEASRKKFTDMVKKVDELVMKEMKPTAEKKLEFDAPIPSHPLLKMVKKLDDIDDIEGFVEEFVMEHDSLFTKHHFVIAGFLDLKFEYDDLDLDFDKYDAYWVSSLCHFKFSNAVFNHGEPQAGVYAPCSIYFYIPKGSNELHVGYARVENWTTTTGIKDKAMLAYMKEVADEVLVVFKKLGFVEKKETGEEPIKTPVSSRGLNPEISELKAAILDLTKEVKALKETLEKSDTNKNKEGKEQEDAGAKIIQKTEVLPKKIFTTEKMTLGDKAPEKLTAYYAANPQTVDGLIKKLKSSGFEILGTTEILKAKTVVTVTNEQLQKSNTFLAALNILVDGTNEIRVQNPSYFAAAYLRNKYKYGEFREVLEALQDSLGDMYVTKEVVELARLRDYNFMPEMSKFNDFVELEEGDDFLDKVTGENADKHIAYTLKLPNGSMLVGHKMRTVTNKFLVKVGEEKNAQLLPYQSMIKDGVVYMLDPTFYLALSLPLLSMEEFMKIASTPDEIGKSIRRAYR
ncbi:MAG: hypothetical protein U9R26_03075 [Campylobacterota bacterium]|nr:hypothetical protein [Campylobacterota bacterium]